VFQTYGRVYDCTRRSDNLKCVLKQVPLGGLSDHDRRETLNEASILRSAQSRHVVTYVDSWEDSESDCLYIVMEHAGEDLSAVMKANGGRLSEDDVWRFLLPVAQGLAHLHSIRVLHRDLKPANIFRTSTPDAGERVVIGDLGLGRVLGAHSDFAKTGVGTPLYFSPELCQEQPYNDKSDVWAFGCLAHELLTGDPPFTAHNQVALASKIVNAPTPALPDDISPDLAFVISKALVKDPARRPSMADILSLSRVRARIERAEMREEVAAEERAMRRAFAEREAALRAELDEARAEAARREAAAEADRSAAELAADPDEIRDVIARMAELEGTNAVLTARLEETEARLADAERARAALAAKLEAAVSAAAAERAAATPFRSPGARRASAGSGSGSASASASASGSIASGRANTNTPGSSQRVGASPGASSSRGGRGGVVVSPSSFPLVPGTPPSPLPPVPASPPPPSNATARTSPARDIPARFAVPSHDEEVEVSVLDVPPASRLSTRGPGDSWRAMGGETAAEDAKDASAPPSPIAPPEEDDTVMAAEEKEVKEAVAVEVSAANASSTKLVARSLNYDDVSIAGSIAGSFAGSLAAAAAAVSAEDGETTAVSLDPSLSTVHSMSDSLDASVGARPAAPPPPPYSGVVFRPVAPAALTPSPPRATPSTPERPVPRATVKGGAAMDARALRVHLPDALAGGDASPFVAVCAWRRLRRGGDEPLPAPAPVGAASRVWDNRGIAAIPPTVAASFIVLYRVAETRAGRATAAVTCKRAKLRGRRARGDDFEHCALIPLGDVRRDDGAAPWRAAEMIPPPGKISELGAWVELVLEFNVAAAVDEVVVLKSDPRMRSLAAGDEAASGADPSSAAAASPAPPSPRVVTRWPGLGGGPVRVGIGKTPEKKTPPRVAGGVFTEGRSPEGPLVGGVSFTPPVDDRRAARRDEQDRDDAPAPAPAPAPAWPLKAEQVAALLRRAGMDENAAPRTSMAASPSREDDDDEGTVGAATRGEGYPSKERFEPEDRALVSDLLQQAQLLQDAVAAAAERLSPGPTRSALTEMASATNALGARPPIQSPGGIGSAFTPPTKTRMGAHSGTPYAPLRHQHGHSRTSVEWDDAGPVAGLGRARARGVAPVPRRWYEPRDGDTDSEQGGSPAFDVSASTRRRRLDEGLLEPRVLF
jgi:hypothetical protein